MKKNIKVMIIALLIYIYPVLGLTSLEDMNQLVVHFDKTLNGLSANDPMIPSLLLRLADALTKRAQLNQAEEMARGCKKCEAGHADIKRALSLYKSIQNKISPEIRGHVFFQIGYINVLLGNEKAAINAYNKIVRSDRWKDLKPKSYVTLGELFYKLNNFRRAKLYFSQSLEFKFPDKGFIIYRIAWCDYHLNELKLAVDGLFKLLKSPQQFLLKDEASELKEIDKLFHREVAKDLATFLSKKDPQNKEIEMLYRLSPRDQKVDNIVYLAKELVRIGNKKKAIFLWKKILPKQIQPINKLESHVWLFQLFVETNQPQYVLQALEVISQLWNEATCNVENDKCKEFKKRISQHIMRWKNEGKSDLSNILKSYLFYLRIFKDDIEATHHAADTAQKLKLWRLSIGKYNEAIQMQKNLIGSSNEKQKKKAVESLENMLLGYIKSAELSKNKRWLRGSYETYLKLGQDRSQWLKAFFLKAKLLYDSEEYEKAADDFISLALMETDKNVSAQNIKLQAARLAVDALVLIKDDIKLERISLRFVDKFPDQASYFMKVNRTSLMNQALALSKNPQRALQILNRINLSGMTDNEKVKYYKNKIILLGQLRRVSDEIQFVNQLLEIESLSGEDKKFALLRKFYLAELMLDFSTMYEINKAFNLENLATDQWVLRKAFSAELAQEEEYIKHYHDFLKLSNDPQKKFEVALKLFKKSPDQESFFKQYKSVLMHKPNILSDILLDNYINDKNKKQMSQILKELVSTDAGKAVWRDEFLQELGPVARQVSQHQIRVKYVDFIEDDIKKRLQLFTELEKKALVGVNAKDLISQVIAFYFVKKEALRLHDDLMFLANSSRLLESQKKEYSSNLKEQAKLYKEKATVIDSQLKTLFDGSQIFNKLEKHLSKSSKAVQVISKSHLALLTNYLPEESKPRLRSILRNITQVKDEKNQVTQPSDSAVYVLREDIKSSPFDKGKIRRLIALEEMRDNKTMVLYLKERRLVMLEE